MSLFAQVQAATGQLKLNLKMLRNSGYGYQLGNSSTDKPTIKPAPLLTDVEFAWNMPYTSSYCL